MSNLTFCKAVFNAVHVRWGHGWKLLGDDLKRAVLSEQIYLKLLRRSDEEEITIAQLGEYRQIMLEYCGLEEET